MLTAAVGDATMCVDYKRGSRDGFSSYSSLNLCFLIINWPLLCNDATSPPGCSNSLSQSNAQTALCELLDHCPHQSSQSLNPPEMLWTTWISWLVSAFYFDCQTTGGRGGWRGAAGAHGQAVFFVLMGGGSHATRPFTQTAAEKWPWVGPGNITSPVVQWSLTIRIRAQRGCNLLKWALTEWIQLPLSEPVGPTWMLGYSNLSPRLSPILSHWPLGMVTCLMLF